MKTKIIDRNKDPLGRMMLDYFNGQKQVYVEVESTTLDMWKMDGEVMFRTITTMSHLEKKALSLCRGKILDIGAGSGCHTLYLQKKGHLVDSLDISPGCVEVMTKRKIPCVIHDSLFSLEDKKYDTLLMLMNGLGICGSLDGLNLFFQFIKSVLSPKGQIIADSTDLASLHASLSLTEGSYYGETEFIMSYEKIIGDSFEWLYIDFTTLQTLAGFHGFACEKIMTDKADRYLARITFKIK